MIFNIFWSTSSCILPLSCQVPSHYRENRLWQRAGPDPLPPVEPSAWRVVSLELAVPAAAGARQPEEAGPESTVLTTGTTHRPSVCCLCGVHMSPGQIWSVLMFNHHCQDSFCQIMKRFSLKQNLRIVWLYVHVFLTLSLSQVFVSGTKVLACWTDCRFYPAKILRVNRDGEALFQLLHLMWCCCALVWQLFLSLMHLMQFACIWGSAFFFLFYIICELNIFGV